MKPTKKVEYALQGLYFLSFVRPRSTVQVRTVAEEVDVPKRFLEQIFLKLREHGLLQSRRGSQGGYTLAVPTSEISLGLLYRVLEDATPPEKPPLNKTGAQRFAWNASNAVWRALDEITLDELMSDDLRTYLRTGGESAVLYYI